MSVSATHSIIPTKYQRTHIPIKRVEAKCVETQRDLQGSCTACRNYVRSSGPHRPNETGSLGWYQYYADGSMLFIAPGADH